MKTQVVVCEECGNSFSKETREITRSKNLGRKQYCSRSCAGKSVHNVSRLINMERKTEQLIPGNRKDEYTGFRQHLQRIKYRDKNCVLTLKDLKEVFDLQNGICSYSKVKLQFTSKKGNNRLYTISIDRKDSSIGYTKENIQFISIAMNHLKNDMTEAEMQEILEILKNT